GRIELRRIRREIVEAKARMGRQKGPNLSAPMNGSAIPEQIHGAAKVPEQMLQEGPNVEPREIARATPQVESQPAAFRRDSQATADGETIVPVPMQQARGVSARRPGATDIGDEQETTFIHEDEMGAAACGVFLSGAIPCTSIGQWPPHRAPRH